MPLRNSVRVQVSEGMKMTLFKVPVSSISLHSLLHLNISMFHDLFPTLT
jgi:hypothetical protein